MTVAYGDVPLIDPVTGRFPDAFAPLSVAAAASAASASAAAAAASAGNAESARDLAVAARVAAEAAAAYTLRGTGSPVGVVTPAAPGVLYFDTNQTAGACAWISTGTTSSSWAVLSGTSGWRNIAAGALNATDWELHATAGKLLAWRNADRVDIVARLKVKADASIIGASRTLSTLVLTLPSGFVYPSQLQYTTLGAATVANSAVAGTLQATDTGRVNVAATSGTWAAGDSLFCGVSFNPSPAWPGALPGTPA